MRTGKDELGKGIDAIYGVRKGKGPKGGKTVLQAIRFSKDKFSAADAEKWLKKHKKKSTVESETGMDRLKNLLENVDDGPEEEDITITSSGSLGGKYAVGIVGGGFIGEFGSWEAAINAVRAYRKKHSFYPNVWDISDHGNVELVNMKGK